MFQDFGYLSRCFGLLEMDIQLFTLHTYTVQGLLLLEMEIQLFYMRFNDFGYLFSFSSDGHAVVCFTCRTCSRISVTFLDFLLLLEMDMQLFYRFSDFGYFSTFSSSSRDGHAVVLQVQ